MEWLIPFVTVLGVFIANSALILSLFLWVRAESRADARHTDLKLESTRELVRAIYDEVRDFHKRLCEIRREKS